MTSYKTSFSLSNYSVKSVILLWVSFHRWRKWDGDDKLYLSTSIYFIPCKGIQDLFPSYLTFSSSLWEERTSLYVNTSTKFNKVSRRVNMCVLVKCFKSCHTADHYHPIHLLSGCISVSSISARRLVGWDTVLLRYSRSLAIRQQWWEVNLPPDKPLGSLVSQV